MADKSVSLREQARAYGRGLTGEAAKVFNETFKEQQESSSVKKAFTAAKAAAAKVQQTTEPAQKFSRSDVDD